MNKKYIIIDLNQTVSRHQLEEKRQELTRDIIMGSFLFILVSIFIWFNVINYNLSSIVNTRNKKISLRQIEIDNLKSDVKIQLAKIDVENLYKFDEKRLFWSPKLMALTNLTPTTMSITKIEFFRKKLNISAITEIEEGKKEFDIVEDFIAKLESNDEFFGDFESIRFIDSSQDNVRNLKIFTFRIEAKIKQKIKHKKKLI